MKVGNINLFSLFVKISTAKSSVKFPLAWQGGFAVGGVRNVKRHNCLCLFWAWIYAGQSLAFGAR